MHPDKTGGEGRSSGGFKQATQVGQKWFPQAEFKYAKPFFWEPNAKGRRCIRNTTKERSLIYDRA